MERGEVRKHYAHLAQNYDRKANKACKRAYRDLAVRWLHDTQRVLEIGAGASDHLSCLTAPVKVACDLSPDMLLAREKGEETTRVVADAGRLPCRDASFDGVLSINLLEHVAQPRGVLLEIARVLEPHGRAVVVTPNGDAAELLHALERLHLKLPEGPHRFLTYQELAGAASPPLRVLEHRRFLALPVGPAKFVETVDRLFSGERGRGLFQYIVLNKEM